MSEAIIFPEMLIAGVEALQEARLADMGDEQTVIALYLAMEGIRAIRTMRDESGFMH